MSRLSLLSLVLAILCGRAITKADEPAPLRLRSGPHLLIDDHLIGEQSFLLRTVNNPKKRPKPVIPGGETYRISQPYVSVVRDAQKGIFRMWYEVPAPGQLGLARMPRDRYVSRLAGPNVGRLLTKPLVLKARSLTVNANVRGTGRVRLLDTKRKPLDGFGWVEFKGDSVEHKIDWSNRLSSVSGQVVRLEFQLKDCQLFGFDLH